MSDFKQFLFTLPEVSHGTTEASVTRDENYWKRVGAESSKTFGPEGAAIEISNNLSEAGFNKIEIDVCTKSSFSMLIKGYGNGIKLADDEYKGKLLKERVDTGKEIGIHKGEGEQKAVCGQIYDKPDGYYLRGHFEKNHDGKRDVHLVIWDGKGPDIVGGVVQVIPEDDFAYIDEVRDCEVFAALTRSNFELYKTDGGDESDRDTLMNALQVNMAPSMLNKGLDVYCKFGNETDYTHIIPADFKLKEFFENSDDDIMNRLISNDRYLVYETDVEKTAEDGTKLKSHLKVTAMNLVSEVRDSEIGNELFMEFAPNLYKTDGRPNLDKIIYCDNDYIYSVKKLSSLSQGDKSSWAGWDQYIVVIVESDANFYRDWGYDSCKLNGFSNPTSELPKYVRDKIRRNVDTLRRVREETKSVDNDSLMFSVNLPQRYGMVKIDDDIDITEIRKSRKGGELYEILPSALLEEFGISEEAAHKMFEVTMNSVFDFMGKFLTREYTRTKSLKADGVKIQKFLNSVLELKP